MARILRAGSQILKAGGAAFSPLSLPDLALWLDATKITGVSNGASLATWNDSSGLGRNAGSGVNATYRTNVQNGLPVVRYAAGYHTIAASTAMFNALHYDGGTVFVVASFGTTDNPNAAYMIMGNNTSGAMFRGYSIWWDDRASASRNNAIVEVVTSASAIVSQSVVPNAVAPQTFAVISSVVKPTESTAANRSAIRVNGGAAATNNTATNAASSGNATINMQIGSYGNTSFGAVADFAEVIIYAAALADVDRQRVERYLGTKWGIAVA